MKAILVFGAEGNGTRLITRLLIAAGCYGDGGHRQRLDTAIVKKPLIVWRRSFPHDKKWPDVKKMIRDLQEAGYDVQAVIIHRDWYAAAQSQTRASHAGTIENAFQNLRDAYRVIAEQTSDIKITLVNYESLIQRQGVIGWLCSQLGIEPPTEIEEIYDANAKWF